MTHTRTGIELLLERKLYENATVGLITNPTGTLPNGKATWRALIEAGYSLKALFGPEHGFRGDAQAGDEVTDEVFRGIQTYSLYKIRWKPEPEMLENLDALLYDIQDVGCRWYTYLYTLAYAMEVCEQTGTKVVVLDRPDPIDATQVEGGPIDARYDNFVGGYGLPSRYGMTVGEFAVYLQKHYFPGLDLDVVWMEGYNRSSYFEETRLPWPLPSPNLPTVDAALLFSGTCLVEGTNLSEGRGTTRPFELIGAPWIDGEQLRDRMSDYDLAGVVFSHLFFTPTFHKQAGELCEGVLIHVTDRRAVSPVRVGLTVLYEIRRLSGDNFAWRELRDGHDQLPIDRLAGGPDLRGWIEQGAKPDELYERFTSGQGEFEEKRKPALHY